MPAVGEIRVAAYRAGGFLSPDSHYGPILRDLGADGNGEVLVAVLPARADQLADQSAAPPAGRILGTIMLQPWPHSGRVAQGPDEAEVRALAVAPDAQGSGVGAALLHGVVERARKTGVGHLVLCTMTEMRAAHRLYERAGFVRLPDRDWSPEPGARLLAYGLPLNGSTAS